MPQYKTPGRKKPSKPTYGAPLSESKSSLGLLLVEAGIILDDRKLDLLWRFHLLLRRHTEEYDLTRLRSFRDIVVKHYIDCMIVPTLIELPSPLLDIGTGAGFPGIPLKIIRPECEIILAESRSRRVEFLEQAVKELGLRGIRIYGRGVLPGRMEEKAAGVITRALETAEKTLNRVEYLLEPGGQVIFMKGPQSGDEIAEARRSHVGSGDRSEKIRTYNFPQNRLTDHRIGLTVYRLESIMDGDIQEVLDQIAAADQAAKLGEALEASAGTAHEED